ncbi:MAG: tRNA pseudouridine(55) synthase TruB, partial [Pseudomonadota bacterium]
MARRQKGRPVNGWIVLDKPTDMTSTQAVSVVKRLLDARKAGHAGTLDPLATGVLPIALGEATKTVNFAVDSHKGYRFAVRWGAETTTDDSEGTPTETSDARPTIADIEDALPQFIGEVEQVPPQFSAIKVDGQRAYDLARDGETIALKSRTVEIEDLRVVDMPDAATTVIEAQCGKGTYVRAIARDLGRLLGCFGHVVQLRRTAVGAFEQDQAVTLDALRAVANGDEVGDPPHAVAQAYLQPISAALRSLEEVALTQNDAG